MNNKVSLYFIIVGIFLGVGLLKVDTGLSQTYNKYNFKYTYLTGDSYTGSVYCAPSYNYSPGKTIAHYTAGKQDGSYQILTGEYDAGYASLYGNVCINSFYDTKNKATYKPLDTKIVTGTEYLGSEQTYVDNDLFTISFDKESSSFSEAATYLRIPFQLNFTSDKQLTFYYTDNPITATSNITDGTGADYYCNSNPSKMRIDFGVGVSKKNLNLLCANDTYNEIDETFRINLVDPGTKVNLGDINTHLVTIIDNDRQALADVKAFGAKGDGIANDTLSVQKAIDYVKSKGGGVVFFPTGTYSVTRVNIDDGITYQGEANSVITRPANQPTGITTFTNRWNVYTGATDSKPLIIKNLIFDGNIENQGAYQHYELEHNNLLFLCGALPEDSQGRLRAIIQDCVFKDSVSDGIALHDNAYVDIYNCETDNCFRGGFVTGGSKLDVNIKNFTLRGDNTVGGSVGGFNIESTWDSSFSIDNMKLYGTDMQTGFTNSTLVGKNIYSDYNAYYWAKDSKIYISNSEFISRSSQNNFFYPSDVTFENCKFSASEKGLAEADRQLSAAPNPIWGVGGNLAYKNCTFSADDSVDAADMVYGILTGPDVIGNNNRLTVDGGVFSKSLDVGLKMKAGGHWSIKNATFEAALPLSVYGYISSSGANNLFDVELDNLTIKSNKYLEIAGNTYKSDNTLTQRNMVMDESANYISSSNGLEGNKYLGNRVVKGTKAPASSTSALLGDIYQLKSDPTKKWQCVKAGYSRTDGSGNFRYTVASQWVPVE